MPNLFLMSVHRQWRTRHKSINLPLSKKRQPVRGRMHHPVDILLGIEANVCREHRNEDLVVADFRYSGLASQLTRGADTLSSEQLDTATMGRGQDGDGRS